MRSKGPYTLRGDYCDILAAIPTPPLWYDEAGVPRYAPFSPGLRSQIYSHETALIVVACQDCARYFKVCWSEPRGKLRAAIEANDQFLYGDPPIHSDMDKEGHEKCIAGDSMNTIAFEILEFWESGLKDGKSSWVRVPELERAIDKDTDGLKKRGWWAD